MSFENILISCGLKTAEGELGAQDLAVDAAPAGFDEIINQTFAPIADCASSIVFYSVPIMDGSGGVLIEVKLLLIWLVMAALFFTVYLNFINFRYFKMAIDVVRGKYDKDDDAGQVSSFQALAASLSGTVGLGNIAGVAVAISVGGPGATIWMILMGFFGMSSKFAEAALGVKYRHHPDPNDPSVISGGPMYYLRDAFANRNMPLLGAFFASLFAICCIGGAVGGGNMFQANQAYQQVVNVTGGDASFFADKGWLFGLGLSLLVGVVIVGGIKSIASVASKLVPLMGLIYMLAGLIVLVIFYQQIPSAFVAIWDSAFSMQAGFGALLGGILNGIQRAAFSNEAGLGSAAIVHSTAKTNSHISQGMVAMLGPFIDTVVICTMTALVITVTGAYANVPEGVDVQGVSLTSEAFAAGISWFPYVLALTVFLFAYSTMITWSYYGEKALTFLCGENKALGYAYKFAFCAFVVIGSSTELSSIVNFSDAMILSLAIPNIVGLYILAPELKADLKDFVAKIKAP